MTDKKAILVIGAGDATGGAIARRFAREGYIACVTRRTVEKLEPLVQQITAEGGQAQGNLQLRREGKHWRVQGEHGGLRINVTLMAAGDAAPVIAV